MIRHIPAPMRSAAIMAILGTVVAGCTVAVKAPTEPITINLNVRIDQEVRVRLDDDVESLIADNPDLFGSQVEEN